MNQRISADKPLVARDALQNDKLNRRGFAEAAVAALERVSDEAGFVISIEGPWGSGKTSVLAMMEQLIRQKDQKSRPIFVHFNPWLVGDRSALLRQFFMSISKELNLKDNAEDAEKAAKALRNYAKVFDFIGYIPGAEPFAGPVRKVIAAAGEAVGGAAEEKKRDLEGKKLRLEKALVKFGRKIYVFIDDIDRLYPDEVYEMVRIVKAVGELPNVGYVLALDSSYVSSALAGAKVPQSTTFIDKIVQVRLPVPAIGVKTRNDLLDQQLMTLPEEVFGRYFQNQDDRFHSVYFHGVRDLLEQPRDIARVVNTLSVIEPSLRGEVVFADILALACLMVKAPYVYNEMKRQPGMFTGESHNNHFGEENKKRAIEASKKHLEAMCKRGSNPSAVASLVKYLFPRAIGDSYNKVDSVEGNIGAPDRFMVAIGQAVGSKDVSLVDARKFIISSNERESISARLTKDNSLEFFELIGDVAASFDADQLEDVDKLCIEISRLLDVLSLEGRLAGRKFFGLDQEGYVRRAIKQIIETKSDGNDDAARVMKTNLAAKIAEDPIAISMAAEVLLAGAYANGKEDLAVCKESVADLSIQFSKNSIALIDNGKMWGLANPSRVIWSLMRLAKDQWPAILQAIKNDDPTLDVFALHFLKSAFSSDGGQSYALPKADDLMALIDMDWFKRHAGERVNDPQIDKVVRNAWRSVVEGKAIFGESGKDARDW